MSVDSVLKEGSADLATILFALGGTIALLVTALSIPIASIYPLTLAANVDVVLLLDLGFGLLCSLGAIDCYSLASKRMLSQAGVRGVIFGALLLVLSQGFLESLRAPGGFTFPSTMSAIMILIAGAICFVLRHTDVSRSALIQPQSIPTRMRA